MARPRRNYLVGEVIDAAESQVESQPDNLALSIEVAELRARVDQQQRQIATMNDAIILLKRTTGVR